ncbi:hypothetical protein D3C81_1597050 [compost metagenome]
MAVRLHLPDHCSGRFQPSCEPRGRFAMQLQHDLFALQIEILQPADQPAGASVIVTYSRDKSAFLKGIDRLVAARSNR